MKKNLAISRCGDCNWKSTHFKFDTIETRCGFTNMLLSDHNLHYEIPVNCPLPDEGIFKFMYGMELPYNEFIANESDDEFISHKIGNGQMVIGKLYETNTMYVPDICETARLRIRNKVAEVFMIYGKETDYHIYILK